MERAWNTFFMAVITVLLAGLITIAAVAISSDKPTKRYRIESQNEGGLGRSLRYYIIEEKSYTSNRVIMLPDSCSIHTAIRIQKELNAQLKVVK